MAWGVQGSVVLTVVIFQGVLGSTRGVRQYLRPNFSGWRGVKREVLSLLRLYSGLPYVNGEGFVLTMVIFPGVLGSTRGVRQYLKPNLAIFPDGLESKGKFCPIFVYISGWPRVLTSAIFHEGLGSTGMLCPHFGTISGWPGVHREGLAPTLEILTS